MTVLDVISGALRLLGVIASGENPAADEAQDALASLNDMIDSWKLERLMVYAILPQTFPLVAGQMSYTMGPGGDFDTERPTRIDKVNLIYPAGSGLPLDLPVEVINQDQYEAFIVPGTQSPIPMWVYPDSGFPLRTLFFYPVPSAANSVEIFTWGLIDGFDSVTDTVSLPPGYARALRFNLALELAAEYGKQIPVTVAAVAQEAKAKIKSFNTPVLYLQVDPALTARRTGFNYLTGE